MAKPSDTPKTPQGTDREQWLIELREFLDNQADADVPNPGSDQGYVPNDAMRLLTELDRLFPRPEIPGDGG